ncbi:hypothetical protein DJ523_07880, partial [Sulfolobus sp. E5]
ITYSDLSIFYEVERIFYKNINLKSKVYLIYTILIYLKSYETSKAIYEWEEISTHINNVNYLLIVNGSSKSISTLRHLMCEELPFLKLGYSALYN